MFNLSTPVGRCKTASDSHFRVKLMAHMALRITYCFEVPLELYPTVDERRDFNARLDDFLKSDSSNQQIFSLQGNTLKYYSEVFVSDKIDNRPPLLLLLGNPASHSVATGMCFAFEKSGLDHRFWKILEESGILTFLEQPPISADLIEKSEMRRNALMELNYLSPFRVGIAVFCSLPSAASNKKWQGVRGVINLLGPKVFGIISLQEENRIAMLISRFIGSTGGIITFQKDAYNRVRSHDTPEYSIYLARRGLLVGKYKSGQHIFLAGAPPTREAYWPLSKSAMLHYKIWLSQQFTTNPCSP
jgi:hypothetical protein